METKLIAQDAKLYITNKEVEIFTQYINSPSYCFDKDYLNKHDAKIDINLSLVLHDIRRVFTAKYQEIARMRNSIITKFISEGKVNTKTDEIYEEFRVEFDNEMNLISDERAELDIKAININYLIDNEYPIAEADLAIIGCVIYVPDQTPVIPEEHVEEDIDVEKMETAEAVDAINTVEKDEEPDCSPEED